VRANLDDHALRELACALVEAARAAGATAADAMVSAGSRLHASARDGEIDEITRESSRAAGVRVLVGGAIGLASASDVPHGAAGIRALADDAVALARVAAPSPFNQMHAPPVASESFDAHTLGAWDDDTANAGAEWVMLQARLVERSLRAHAGVNGTKDAAASVSNGRQALATSSGFCALHRGTSATLSVSGYLDDDDGRKQVDGHFDTKRRLADLADPESVGSEAARRVLARRGARKIESATVPVVLAPQVGRGFLGAILAAACGDVVARGKSFLSGKLGIQVMAAGIHVVDDPLLAGGLGSRGFDGEGLPTKRTTIIDASGRLRSFFLDQRSAAELSMSSTAHAHRGARTLPSPGPTNIIIEGGSGDLNAIVRETPNGFLVTRLMGRAIDPVSGDISRAAAGFWIEGGAIAFPVEEVTIAGNALELLMAIDRVGTDADDCTAMRVPTLRIASVRIAGR
jgi:PmbA protein